MQPGMTVSAVARQHGVSPSLLFKWRQQMSQGGQVRGQRGPPRSVTSGAPNEERPGTNVPGRLLSVVAGTRGRCWHKTARPLDFFMFHEIEDAHKLAA
jgi:hypothetical protein